MGSGEELRINFFVESLQKKIVESKINFFIIRIKYFFYFRKVCLTWSGNWCQSLNNNECGSLNSNAYYISTKDKQDNLDDFLEYIQIYISRKTLEYMIDRHNVRYMCWVTTLYHLTR